MPSRRTFLAALGALPLAGCSAGRSPAELLITAINHTESRHALSVVVTRDDEPIVNHRTEVPAGTADHNPSVSTLLTLDGVSRGDRLRYEATLDADVVEDDYVVVDCAPEYRGDQITVRIHGPDHLQTFGDGDANSCFTAEAIPTAAGGGE